MRSVPRLLVTVFAFALAACDGDDSGSGGDAGPIDGGPVDAAPVDAAPEDAAPDAPDPDAAVACPTLDDCEISSRAGVIYRDGCAPFACGLYRYRVRDIAGSAAGESMAVGGLGPTHVTYVRTTPSRQVRMSTFEGIWSDELVATVVAGGATGGTAVTRISDAGGATIWVAWAESDDTIHVARRLDQIVDPPWTVTRDVAVGRNPVLVGAASQPLLVYAGAGGIHVRSWNGSAWSTPVVVTADVAAFAATRYNDGFDNVMVAWRTPAQDVKVARSRAGQGFVTTDLETGVTANPDGASLAFFNASAPVLVYTLDGDTSVAATLDSNDVWHKEPFGHFDGQGSGVGAAQSVHGARAYTSAAGLHALDAVGPGEAPTEQVVSTRCGHGRLAAGSYLTDPVLVHHCSNGSIYALHGSGAGFPDGWNQRCRAVADTLADTARSCATGDACVSKGSRSLCGTGADVDDLAYAQTCGDPTVHPAIIDACEAAAPGAACVPSGTTGTTTVPAACAP